MLYRMWKEHAIERVCHSRKYMEGKRDAKAKIENLRGGVPIYGLVRKSFVGSSCYVVTAVFCAVVTVIRYQVGGM
eukprot:COSAG01_NODE_55_length_31115_cov_105.202533_19_plen_75_part_00